MESVPGARVGVHLEGLAVFLESRLVLGPRLIDEIVVLGVVDQQRRLDVADLGGRGRGSVERCAGIEVGAKPYRQPVHHAASPAEPDRAQLAGRQFVILEKVGAVDHVLAQLLLIQGALHGAAVVVVAGVAADGGQSIGSQGHESRHRGSARNILDVGIETAVLVDYQNRREWAGADGLHQVAAHLARAATG